VRTYGEIANSASEAVSEAVKILKARGAKTQGAMKLAESIVAVTPPCSPPTLSSSLPSYDASPLAASTTLAVTNLEEIKAQIKAEVYAEMKSEMGAEHVKHLEMNDDDDDDDNEDNNISISVDDKELEVSLPDLLSLSLILTTYDFDSDLIHMLNVR